MVCGSCQHCVCYDPAVACCMIHPALWCLVHAVWLGIVYYNTCRGGVMQTAREVSNTRLGDSGHSMVPPSIQILHHCWFYLCFIISSHSVVCKYQSIVSLYVSLGHVTLLLSFFCLAVIAGCSCSSGADVSFLMFIMLCTAHRWCAAV